MIYPENDTTYHTEEVFVTEKWRNKGLAKALIAEALNYLKSKGIKSALLSVTSNRTIAMKIYSDCGYKTTLTRKVMIKTI